VQAGGELITQVPDSLYDAGRGVSVSLDQDGNPVASYVLLKPTLKEDELPPPVLPGQPQPPAILVAAQQEGAWVRTSVTPQSTNPAEGEAEGISDEEGRAGPDVSTSLALDGQGTHHVAWSSSQGVFYGTDAGGSFGEPERVVEGATIGVGVAVGSDGSPWISFYRLGELQVAHPEGDGWSVETVAPAPAADDAVAVISGIAVTSDGEPVVAFGRGDATAVATRDGEEWTTEDVPGPGGLGVSLDVDGEGNPHVAYYDQSGGVHHAHSIGGAPFEVTDLSTTSASGEPEDTWGTGIALNDEGVHYIVYADPAADEVFLSTNQSGDFEATPVPNSQSGGNPSIAVSGDGQDLAVAFFDSENANLEVAIAPEGGLNLAFPPPATTGPAPTAAPPAAECEPDGTELSTVAQNIAFDTDCLAAPADTAFTIEFDNQDPGTPHNVTIYTDASAAEVLGGAGSAADFITGPDQVTYEVDPIEAGEYFFRCDLHPTNMVGTFISA
jgi:plastocyanin